MSDYDKRKNDLGDYIHSLYQIKLEVCKLRDRLNQLINRLDDIVQEEADDMVVKRDNLN